MLLMFLVPINFEDADGNYAYATHTGERSWQTRIQSG